MDSLGIYLSVQAELNGSPVPDEDASPFAVREVDENEGGKDETVSALTVHLAGDRDTRQYRLISDITLSPIA